MEPLVEIIVSFAVVWGKVLEVLVPFEKVSGIFDTFSVISWIVSVVLFIAKEIVSFSIVWGKIVKVLFSSSAVSELEVLVVSFSVDSGIVIDILVSFSTIS